MRELVEGSFLLDSFSMEIVRWSDLKSFYGTADIDNIRRQLFREGFDVDVVLDITRDYIEGRESIIIVPKDYPGYSKRVKVFRRFLELLEEVK